MYKAILFSPDGDFVTDCEAETVEKVWEKVNELGSKWYFYPIPAVVHNVGRVTPEAILVDVTPAMSEYRRRKVRTLQTDLRNHPEEFDHLF